MAGEMTNVSSRNNRGIQGLGFASGVYIAYDTMSTLNSSPWTHETFGGNPGKAESAQRYVRMAMLRSTGLALITSWLMNSITPLLGASVANADLFYVYWKAKELATSKGS